MLDIDRDRIYFSSDGEKEYWVSLDINSMWYYGKWFYTNQELRKVKLDKLEQVFNSNGL